MFQRILDDISSIAEAISKKSPRQARRLHQLVDEFAGALGEECDAIASELCTSSVSLSRRLEAICRSWKFTSRTLREDPRACTLLLHRGSVWPPPAKAHVSGAVVVVVGYWRPSFPGPAYHASKYP